MVAAWYIPCAMRYLCVHCDHRWASEGSEPPKRCPSCMRATGVEAVSDGAKTAPKSKLHRYAPWAIVAALAIGLTILLVARRSHDPSATNALAPRDPEELLALLKKEQIDAAGLELLFAADAAMEAQAEKVAGDKDGPFARAEAIQAWLRARASALAFVPWSLGELRPSPVMLSRDVFPLVQKDKGRAQLYPLELSALAASLLRAIDVPALVAELPELPGERAPLDQSGYLGYFVVAVYEDEPGVGTPRFYDPYAGRNLKPETKAHVLGDTQVVGALLGLRALHEMAYRADTKAALETSAHALAVGQTLPSVRTARGLVVLSGNMMEQGLQELAAARQQRPDAPRMRNLAHARLITGDLASAEKEINAALAKAPDFAAGHATLAEMLLLRGDMDAARAELLTAQKLSPELSSPEWRLLDIAARSGASEDVLARARALRDARPSFEARLHYALLLRQGSKYEEMRKAAHELLAFVPDYRKDEVRELLAQALGPTALDAVEADPSAADLDDLGGPGLDLKLSPGSGLLAEPAKGDSLKLDGEPQAGDPLILLGDPSKLRLRGSSDQLELKLDR
jgi:tetratricopeptide (TPR) repeat protein